MFDTMTMVKTFGALCGALLIFMLGGWFASAIYSEGGHHAGGEHVQGYLIATETDAAPAEEAEPELPFEERFAAADASAGERAFRQCSACHSVAAGENKTGPSLHGVVGRPVDAVDGFNYSGALEQVVQEWTPENLYHFIENPRGFAPGTSMGFAGISKSEDRLNLIAWLATQAG